MSKPTVVTVRMPHSLKVKISELADSEGISLNQFIVYSLTGVATEAQTVALMQEITGGRSREEILTDFDRVMEKLRQRPTLPDEEVPEWDRMPD